MKQKIKKENKNMFIVKLYSQVDKQTLYLSSVDFTTFSKSMDDSILFTNEQKAVRYATKAENFISLLYSNNFIGQVENIKLNFDAVALV